MDTTAPSSLLIAAWVLDVSALALLAWRWRAVRGTTLVGPWMWLVGSLTVVPLGVGRADALRLLTSAVTLCPAMALLGAKRPQDKPWHFIVATLWLVLALPGLQALLFGQGGEIAMHAARSWFLVILILLGVCNSVFSRYGVPVLLAGGGQLILFSPFLPPAFRARFSGEMSWGLALYALAVILVAAFPARRRGQSLQRLWGDFRDAFGLVWTLRVMERIQAATQANGWDLHVGWRGFRHRDGTSLDEDDAAGGLTAEQLRAFRQHLSNLLRRFVNEPWISRRLGDP